MGHGLFLDDIEDLIVPEDLKKALNKNKTAIENFNSFNDSHKKQVLYWVVSAKMRKIRKRRIKMIFEAALENKMPFN